MKQLFIPEKIKVGYQHRQDTYTKKLAYVIYFDSRGKLRKEKSWTSWCDLPESPNEGRHWTGEDWADDPEGGIPSDEFGNVPTEGFVLNKKVGGHSSGWNHRNAYTRVFDPRGFEFEISVENLLFILAEGDCTRGKGLEGKFVYSWQGTELVLLPTHCNDYKNCIDYTSLQGKKISLRDIVAGNTYVTKNQTEYVYLGRLEKNKLKRDHLFKGHIFYNIKEDKFSQFKSGSSLAICKSNECHPDLAELIERYDIANSNTEIAKIELEDGSYKEQWRGEDHFCEFQGDIYSYSVEFYDSWCSDDWDVFDPTKHLVKLSSKYVIEDGQLEKQSCDYVIWHPKFKAPPLKKNPHYNPNCKKPTYSYYNNWQQPDQEFLKDGYRHSGAKLVGEVELGLKKLVLTTKDGRKFTTDTYRFKLKD